MDSDLSRGKPQPLRFPCCLSLKQTPLEPWEMHRATKSRCIYNYYSAVWTREYERAAKDLLLFKLPGKGHRAYQQPFFFLQ